MSHFALLFAMFFVLVVITAIEVFSVARRYPLSWGGRTKHLVTVNLTLSVLFFFIAMLELVKVIKATM
tara:strand:+ start:272 stop:475 length:204 start_codon:yes stop_codon:yes gene_type:complete